jgi:hypothetical protein
VNKNNSNNNEQGDGNFSFFVSQPKDEAPNKQQQQEQSGFPNFPLAGFAPSTTAAPRPPPQGSILQNFISAENFSD